MHLNPGVRLTLLLPKRSDLSFLEFQQAYTDHCKIAEPVLRKYGATYYSVVLLNNPVPLLCGYTSANECVSSDEQQFNTPNIKTAASDALASPGDMNSGFHAITTVKFRHMDDLERYWHSRESKEFIQPDGENFIDMQRMKVDVGMELEIIPDY